MTSGERPSGGPGRRGAHALPVELPVRRLGVRSEGATGDNAVQFTWRWTETPEERFLAHTGDERDAPRMPPSVHIVAETGADWPGFRGPDRDGSVPGVRIETDWSRSPPVELWRRSVGPGWSSFAVRGDRVYTREQRGDDEVVASYRLTTGEPVWTHRRRRPVVASRGLAISC